DANIAANLESFHNLLVLDGDGTDPNEVSYLYRAAFSHARAMKGPVLVRLRVPRMCGHSGADRQNYRPRHELESSAAMDPLTKLRAFYDSLPHKAMAWDDICAAAKQNVERVVEAALARPSPDPETLKTHVFAEIQSNECRCPAEEPEPTACPSPEE